MSIKTERFLGGIAMNGRRLTALLLTALLMLGGTGCERRETPDASSSGDQSEPAVSAMVPLPEPEPEPEPVLPYTNPLTGEGCETDISQNRPIAIMLNNLKKALPQMGVSQADLIFEIPAEGGITRMLAVFQDVSDVGTIGTVRSARDYYVSLALGMDALYLHAGGSPQAYTFIKNQGVAALDCVNGPYEGTLFWRDKDRRKNAGYEHSVVTTGEKISTLLPTYRYRLEHKDGYSYPMSFAQNAVPADGRLADTITVEFSTYKTGVFRYDAETELYKVEEYGQPYVDGNNDQQVAVKNVLILQTDISLIKGDEAGRLSVRTTGTGKGVFACGGKCMDITWSKPSHTEPMTFTDANGQELQFGVGTTYINIIGSSAAYRCE